MEPKRKSMLDRMVAPLQETFGLTEGMAAAAVAVIFLVMFAAVFWFIYSTPRSSIIITTGPAGSIFEATALHYRTTGTFTNKFVKERLRVLRSKGSQENLDRLADPTINVDVGFVQGGITNSTFAIYNVIEADTNVTLATPGHDQPTTNITEAITNVTYVTTNREYVQKLVSLGSVSYEPLWVFYRSGTPAALLSEFKGKKIAIGPVGSGTHALATDLLALNDVSTTNSVFLDYDAEEAAAALASGKVDLAFMMGDSASGKIMRELLHAPNIQLFDFTQADGYVRRITYLNKLVLPRGSLDFGRDIPPHDINLVGPTVELLARPDMHPALIDLLLDAARDVNGGAKLLQHKGEFPAPLVHDFPISPEAARYYKSGKGFLYRYLPFGLAGLLTRVLVAFVPALVVLVPVLRLIPAGYKWRLRLRLYRWYRAMLALEHEVQQSPMSKEQHDKLLSQVDAIEENVNQMKVPASFADQYYALRTYVVFVRQQLTQKVLEK